MATGNEPGAEEESELGAGVDEPSGVSAKAPRHRCDGPDEGGPDEGGPGEGGQGEGGEGEGGEGEGGQVPAGRHRRLVGAGSAVLGLGVVLLGYAAFGPQDRTEPGVVTSVADGAALARAAGSGSVAATTPQLTTTPSASTRTRSSVETTVRPSRTGSVSRESVSGSTATAAATSPAAAGGTTRSTTTTAAFTPITIDATDPRNTLSGGAEAVSCTGCASGSRVRYIDADAAVSVPVRGVGVAGTRTLTISYESDGLRDLQVTVNDVPVRTLSLAGAGDWQTPARVSLRVQLERGANTIVFANPSGPAPDLDRFRIS